MVRLILHITFLIILVVVSLRFVNPQSLFANYPEFSNVDWLVIGCWLSVLFLIVSVFRHFTKLRCTKQLDKDGISTSGVITQRKINYGVDWDDYILTYSYLTDQQANVSVLSRIYDSAREGDQVQVFYLPNRPSVSRLELSSIPIRKLTVEHNRPTPFWDDKIPRD
jgi:hypothetical protein